MTILEVTANEARVNERAHAWTIDAAMTEPGFYRWTTDDRGVSLIDGPYKSAADARDGGK